MANVLELQGVSKRFGALEILRHMNWTLGTGESVAILGPSGAGKSTLLHIAGLMEQPSEGAVVIHGQNMTSLSDNCRAHERLHTIGFLFQFHHLLPDFSVVENVLMPARLAGDDLNRSLEEATALLKRLGLGDRLHHKPHQLSGGEQQRAGLARALIRKPRLLLCDEPTGNLDPRTAQDVMEFVWSETKREGISTVVVTHNETLARQAGIAYHLVEGNFVELNLKAET